MHPQRRLDHNRNSFQYRALEARAMLAGGVIISEFVASNLGSFLDTYEESPDWIELHNQGDTAVDLLGYHLTDDPADPIGWTFNASSVIGAGEYKVIFASSRNEIDPAGYFHTDFNLGSGGEYIALYDDNLALLSEYGTGGSNYPAQLTDVSYGIPQGTLVNRSSVAQYLIPSDNSLETTWYNNNFDAEANGFTDSRTSIGYENDVGSTTSYADEILKTVPSGTTSLYLRNEFHLDDASNVTDLVFNVKYDDGFGVWLNGQFLFSENAGNGFAWDTSADAIHNDADALQYQSYSLDGSAGSVGNFLNLLVDGKNTLAIHALNESNTSSDFLMSPQLITTSIAGPVSYLASPTPEQPNSSTAVLGPQIADVTPTSTSISQGQSIVVTARVLQFDLPVDTASIALHYRVMFGNEVTVAMNDNGTGVDAIAGDGIFSATLNSSSVPAGQMVRWYLTASDTDGGLTRAPRFFDALDSAEYFGAVIVDTTIDTDLPLIQWFIEDTAAANTDFGTRASIFYDGQFYDNVQVDIHGQSTRGGDFPKKSYDFDANSGEKFQIPTIGAASDFNMLTNYADQTKVRHPLAYEILTTAGVPTLHGAATTVYRNGSYYGLYDVIEEGDEEYLERVGLDSNGALYKVNNNLSDAYNEVSKKTRNYENHDDFQEVIDGAALSGSAATTWDFDHLDVAGLINYVAVQSLLANQDFGHKNMYWYRDTEGTGLWTALPWDQDLSLGHRWTASVSPPYFDNTLYSNQPINVGLNGLFQRIYSTPTTRDMFFRRLKTLSDQFYGEPGTSVASSYVHQRLGEIESLIEDEVADDIAEWGIQANFAAAYPFNPAQAIDQLQDVFINARRNYINDDSRTPNAQTGTPAILFDTVDFDSSPASGLQSEEYVRLNNPGSTAVDISGWKLSGGISHTFKHGTVIPAGESLFVVADVVAFQSRATGPTAGQQLFIQGNYSGNISNLGETLELHSDAGVFVDNLTTPNSGLTANQEFLRISEFNYNPSDFVADAEYIEFLNTGTTTLDLSGVSVTEGPSTPFVFPAGTMLAAGERILIVQDLTAFSNAYPSVPTAKIVGTYSGKLSNSGENIRVEESGGEVILQVSYGDSNPWHFATDGDGATLQLANEFGTSLLEIGKHYSWRPSYAINGTPGEAPIAVPNVVINEILAHTDAPLTDSIELFNPTGQAILIGGLFLSDSANDFLKYQIPAGTLLGAGEYVVFDESHFNPTPTTPGPKDFSLSASNGDQVWLTAAAGGVPNAIYAQADFGATFNGESLARVPNGTGRLLPSTGTTLGSENLASRVGPLIISEVNYHPENPSPSALAIEPTITAGDLEFIEVTNPTLQTVDLTNWRLRGEIDFDFASATMSPGDTIVVVTFDPSLVANASLLAAFRAHYGIDSSVPLVGADGIGGLNNSTGRVSLQQPDMPPVSDPTSVPHVLVDEVVYDDLAPWDVVADGNGPSLNRIAAGVEGTAATNWTNLSPTPGVAAVEATIVTRSLFYNNSTFDGGSSSANVDDDMSVANGLAPLFAGETATFANYSNYVHGLNGVMIDVFGLTSTPDSSDFLFRIGNNDDTTTWTAAPDPVSVSVRPGDGAGVADRVSLVWADAAITNTWLQISVLADGVSTPDVFYYGNVIGEAKNDPANTFVNANDIAEVRSNLTGFFLTDIDNVFDFNRDRRVNADDIDIARNNLSGFFPVKLITPTGGSLNRGLGRGSIVIGGDQDGGGKVSRTDLQDFSDAEFRVNLEDDQFKVCYLPLLSTKDAVAKLASEVTFVSNQLRALDRFFFQYDDVETKQNPKSRSAELESALSPIESLLV